MGPAPASPISLSFPLIPRTVSRSGILLRTAQDSPWASIFNQMSSKHLHGPADSNCLSCPSLPSLHGTPELTAPACPVWWTEGRASLQVQPRALTSKCLTEMGWGCFLELGGIQEPALAPWSDCGGALLSRCLTPTAPRGRGRLGLAPGWTVIWTGFPALQNSAFPFLPSPEDFFFPLH